MDSQTLDCAQWTVTSWQWWLSWEADSCLCNLMFLLNSKWSKTNSYSTSGHSTHRMSLWQWPLTSQTWEGVQGAFPGCLPESLVTGRFSPVQVMGCWPCTLEIFGVENHLSGADTLAGLSLARRSVWYLKRRPRMDLNLFLVFKKSAPSKERSGHADNKMKPPTWTIHTCTGVEQKRPLPPTWFSLQAKAREDGRDTAGLPLRPRGPQTQPG